MTRTPFRLALAAVAAALLLAGCGTSSGSEASDDPTTTAAKATTTEATETTAVDTTEVEETTTTEAADDAICEPLQVLHDYDQQSADVIASDDWSAIQAFFVDGTDDVLTAYDDAIALDSEITTDLEELKAITAGTSDLAAGASSFEDLSTQLLALPGLQSAGEAGLRLNTFAEETCGFSTGGAGN